MLTRTGKVEPATSPAATIGAWATTSRPEVHRSPSHRCRRQRRTRSWSQMQRMGNPLINELLIGTGSKDRFSMDRAEE